MSQVVLETQLERKRKGTCSSDVDSTSGVKSVIKTGIVVAIALIPQIIRKLFKSRIMHHGSKNNVAEEDPGKKMKFCERYGLPSKP
jgi:hypothetical protein